MSRFKIGSSATRRRKREALAKAVAEAPRAAPAPVEDGVVTITSEDVAAWRDEAQKLRAASALTFHRDKSLLLRINALDRKIAAAEFLFSHPLSAPWP